MDEESPSHLIHKCNAYITFRLSLFGTDIILHEGSAFRNHPPVASLFPTEEETDDRRMWRERYLNHKPNQAEDDDYSVYTLTSEPYQSQSFWPLFLRVFLDDTMGTSRVL